MTAITLLPEVRDHEFTIAVLGGFRLVWGTTVVSVPRSSQRLLRFMALHGGVVKRAKLTGVLWPDASERRAYCNLRAAPARLGSRGHKALATSKLELGLADGATVDLRQARTLAWRLLNPAAPPNPSNLRMAAVAALSVDLQPDWHGDSVLAEGEDWRQLRLHALVKLTGHLTSIGRCGEATGTGRAVMRTEPLKEAATARPHRCTWPRAISRRRCANLHAPGHSWAPSSVLSPRPAAPAGRGSAQPVIARTARRGPAGVASCSRSVASGSLSQHTSRVTSNPWVEET
jgi:SARP family transcriptional regulator, regulator of embCAB operon